MRITRIFRTHTEITPYKEGDCIQLENFLSIWNTHTYSRNKIAYMVEGDTMYIPRGISPNFLEKMFGEPPILETSSDPYEYIRTQPTSLYPPRNKIQEDSISFLCSAGNFARGSKYAQLSLNADTGDGKTFCTVYSICNLNMRALIITHIEKIKAQWIDTCATMFTFDSKNLVDIAGTNVMEKILYSDEVPQGDVFFVNHQTLNAFVRKHGYEKLHDFFIKLRIGIKVYDEAHLEFRNILMIDMFSNTYKTIYLTANFDRSQPDESRIFKRAFANVMQFGTQTLNYAEKRKHVVYFPIMYSSDCPPFQAMAFKNNYGFDSKRFIEYALNHDSKGTLMNEIYKVLKRLITRYVEGRILIIVPKIEACEIVCKELRRWSMLADKEIMTIHSKNTTSHNDNAKVNADIIVSTMKSVGTGADIKGLRVLINTEPYASSIIANQMSGRLREFAPDKDTYYFDLVDASVPRCYEMYKIRLRFLKKKCKEIVMDSHCAPVAKKESSITVSK